ncbi:hypothetical protein FOCC_FOCC015641, partial [Frankliniella occidentalis]
MELRLFVASQVAPQKSEVQLVPDGEGAADAEQRWARLEEDEEDEEREGQADVARTQSMMRVRGVSPGDQPEPEVRDSAPIMSPRTSSEALGYRMDEVADDTAVGSVLPGSPAAVDGDQRGKTDAPPAGV